MQISRDTLRGYILEEVLAYLIRNTGYRLLVDPCQDPQELDWRHNGLVVKGRGAVHQVDVLGELSWIPAFTFPLRLFVEAKFRAKSTGIAEIRNLIATLLDVNQRNFPQLAKNTGASPQPSAKYHYAGAIFSTSGFSPSAMDMALAHGASLVDLDTPEFGPLLDGIAAAADAIITPLHKTEYEVPAEDIDGETGIGSNERSRQGIVAATRLAIRQHLGTQPSSVPLPVAGPALDLLPALQSCFDAARVVDELFVGMANGPYMLVLKAENPRSFLDYARNFPTHDVRITWSRHLDAGRTWTVQPLHGEKNKEFAAVSTRSSVSRAFSVFDGEIVPLFSEP